MRSLKNNLQDKQAKKEFLTLTQARDNKLKIDWLSQNITKPSFLGNKVYLDFDLNKISRKINWSFFFLSFELKGRYPDIFSDPKMGSQAKKLYQDGQVLLKEIIENNKLKAKSSCRVLSSQHYWR